MYYTFWTGGCFMQHYSPYVYDYSRHQYVPYSHPHYASYTYGVYGSNGYYWNQNPQLQQYDQNVYRQQHAQNYAQQVQQNPYWWYDQYRRQNSKAVSYDDYYDEYLDDLPDSFLGRLFTMIIYYVRKLFMIRNGYRYAY